jgi:hypothetical protein
MVIGCLRLTLTLAENRSLKGKRSVVRRVSERVRHKFAVAVAEVDTLDDWNVATLGIVCVSNDARQSHAVLMKVRDFVEQLHLDSDVAEIETEIVHAL